MHTRIAYRALGIAVSLLLPLAGPAVALRSVQAVGMANVRVSQDAYPAHAEPSIAVNPRDPRNLLGAAMLLGHGQTLLGAFASFDGGLTWRDNGPLPLPPGTVFGDDATVAFDAQGAGFIEAMATSGAVRSDRGVYVWRTDDGGRHFQPAVAAMRRQFADHPWLAGDTTPGAGRGTLYAAWVAEDHAALGFTRSTDGGHSFAPAQDIAVPSGVSIPAVAAGPRAAVYIAFESMRQGADVPIDPDAGSAASAAHVLSVDHVAPPQPDAQVEVVSSMDGGRHFGPPVALGAVPSTVFVSPQQDLSTGPSIAVDPQVGVVYVAYTAYRAGSAQTDIMVARSRDNGRTWSTPVRASAHPRPGDAICFQPQVVVDNAGTVDVTYFALHHDRVDVILARSSVHGAGFGSRVTVTSRPFDPGLGMRGGGTGGKDSLWWIGDYQGLATGGGSIHPFWNDTRPGRLEIFTATIPT